MLRPVDHLIDGHRALQQRPSSIGPPEVLQYQGEIAQAECHLGVVRPTYGLADRQRPLYQRQLRALLDAARADPQVIAFPYEGPRHLVGEGPTRCRRGHRHQGRDGRSAAEKGWLACRCGGHATYACANRLTPKD